MHHANLAYGMANVLGGTAIMRGDICRFAAWLGALTLQAFVHAVGVLSPVPCSSCVQPSMLMEDAMLMKHWKSACGVLLP